MSYATPPGQPLATGNYVVPPSVAVAMQDQKNNSPLMSAMPVAPVAPRYLGVWFHTWQWSPGDVVEAYATNHVKEASFMLDKKQKDSAGFGVLIDQTDATMTYWLTPQTSLERARHCAYKFVEHRTEKDTRKPGDRTEWQGKMPIRKTVSTGQWDTLREAEKLEDRRNG